MNYCTDLPSPLYWIPTAAALLAVVMYVAYALGKASQRKETALYAAENIRLRNKHLLHLSSKQIRPGAKSGKNKRGKTK